MSLESIRYEDTTMIISHLAVLSRWRSVRALCRTERVPEHPGTEAASDAEGGGLVQRGWTTPGRRQLRVERTGVAGAPGRRAGAAARRAVRPAHTLCRTGRRRHRPRTLNRSGAS